MSYSQEQVLFCRWWSWWRHMFCHCPLLLISRLSVFWGIHEASSSTWTPPDQEALGSWLLSSAPNGLKSAPPERSRDGALGTASNKTGFDWRFIPSQRFSQSEGLSDSTGLDAWVKNWLGVQPLRFQDLHGRDFISRLMYFEISRDCMKNIHGAIFFIDQSCQSKLSDTTPISLSRTKQAEKSFLLWRCR